MSNEKAFLNTLIEQNPEWNIQDDEDCISITNHEGLDIFMVIGQAQITLTSLLFPVSSVTDTSALNELILNTHQLMPLTSIAIQKYSDEAFYVAFGSLSKISSDTAIIEEVETLFENVGEFIELFAPHIGEIAA